MILFRKGNSLQFSPNDIEICIMLFADNIVLLPATITGMQNQITELYNAANRLRLQVNLSKTKVMVFRKGGYLSARERWFYGTERLEVVNTYRYLGLTFSTRLSFRVATDGEHLTRAKRGTIEICENSEEVELFFTWTLLQAL